MNEQQEKLYQALLDQNERAKAAGDPYIVDPERARTTLAALAALVDAETAAGICADITSGSFEKSLAEEMRIEKGIKEDYATGRMDYLFMLLYMMNAGTDKHEMWRAMRRATAALSTGMVQLSQQKVTNYFSRFIKGPRQRKFSEENPTKYAEELTIPAGNGKHYSMMLEYADLHKLRVSTQMILHFLLKDFAQTHRPSVELPLREYAELRGKGTSKNTLDELQGQVFEDLSTLGDLKANWYEKRIEIVNGKRKTVYRQTGYRRLNGGTVDVSRYIIKWNWNADILPSLQTLAPLDFPEEYFRLSPADNSYPLAHYIALNYRRNEDKGPARYSKIKIETLLKEVDLPDYEKVKKQRKVKERLIRPFFRDLNKVPRLVYELFLANGTRVDDIENLSDEDFLAAYIEVDYSAYPVHQHRIEQKKRHEETKNKIAEQAKIANAVKTARRGKKNADKK